MDRLRRAAIWTVAIELPLAALALLSTMAPLYTAWPLVLIVHLPGVALLDTLHMCCGLASRSLITDAPGFQPPVLVSIGILALANAVAIFLVVWAVELVRGRVRRGATAAHP
ncbi:MAG TPA: hypothetical protein VIW26_00555 [Gemmatimonadales bacterium]|jgi:hypothetical protein